MEDDYLLIITDDIAVSEPIEGQKGWGEEFQKKISKLREVKLPVAELEAKMQSFLQLVVRLFKQADQIGSTSDMQLGEVELSVEISGEGEIKLVAGGKAAGKGAITLKFVRSDSK